MTFRRLGESIGEIADDPTNTLVAAVTTALVFALLDYITDSAMLTVGVFPELHAAAQATIIGLVVGLSTFLVLVARRHRRRAVRDQLAQLAELNHRLRNSLEIIVDAHYLGADESHKKIILDTVATMDAALSQLFPVTKSIRRPVSE